MRRLRLFAILSVLCGAVTADEPRGDLARLQGTWETKVGPKKDLPITWTIEGDRLVARITREDASKVTTRCRIKLDEAARPKRLDQIEMRVDFGGEDGELAAEEDSLAIYEIHGDEWKVGLAPIGSPRPRALAAGPDSDLLVFKRVPADKGKAPEKRP